LFEFEIDLNLELNLKNRTPFSKLKLLLRPNPQPTHPSLLLFFSFLPHVKPNISPASPLYSSLSFFLFPSSRDLSWPSTGPVANQFHPDALPGPNPRRVITRPARCSDPAIAAHHCLPRHHSTTEPEPLAYIVVG
jgi:hypothetical protein